MCRFTLVFGSLVCLVGAACAGDPPQPGPWKFTTAIGANVSQSAFSSNWAGGDKGSFVWALTANPRAERQVTAHVNWTNDMKLAYGQTSRQESGPDGALTWSTPIKSTDQIQFESTGRWTSTGAVNPYVSLRLDSQFKDQSSPIGTINVNPIKLSETAGLARVLQKTEDAEAITRIGFGFRQVLGRAFVNATTKETASYSANDGGIEWTTTSKRPILQKRVTYDSKLTVFLPVFYSQNSALEDFDAMMLAADGPHESVAGFWKQPDVNFLNTLTAQITKAINVNLTAQAVYDKFDAATNVDTTLPLDVLTGEVNRGIRKAVQIREVLALGITYQLF